ncbi:MAG: response regulator [Desulfobacterales bacterium]|jgi:two-component system cell cycle response regulator
MENKTMMEVDGNKLNPENEGQKRQPRNNNRILIVDDEPLNVKLLEAILASDSYEIKTALNGEQALEQVNKESPDLILLDIMMPGMDGFEVTRALKADVHTNDIPIILITAYDMADYKVIGHEAGADEFLNKPVNAPELRSRVKSLLRTKEYQDKWKRQRRIESSNGSERKEKYLPAETDIPTLILVCDDEDDAKLIQMYLNGQPYEVVIKKTTKEAIAMSDKKRTDLILLDVMLQGEECFDSCCQLKEREQTANTQILMLASSEDLETKHKQVELWADDFLIKPININELRARVKALLKKKTYLDRLYAGNTGSVQSAITDSLTGLANHSYFKHFLEHEIKRSERDSRPVALIMIELSNVRPQPNSLGHPAGEEFLKDVGALIQGNIREVDIGARCKERKFAMVLPNTDEKGAWIAAGRIKDKILNHFSVCPKTVSTNWSSLNMGIAVYPSDADSIDLLIHKAEKALFDSKTK